jgi:hypothetical protein
MLRGGQEGIRPAAAAEDCNVVAQGMRRREPADCSVAHTAAVTPPPRKEYDRYFQTGTDLKGLDRRFLCGRELSYSENLATTRFSRGQGHRIGSAPENLYATALKALNSSAVKISHGQPKANTRLNCRTCSQYDAIRARADQFRQPSFVLTQPIAFRQA